MSTSEAQQALAELLAGLRREWTGKDFAAKLGWPASRVSRIENARQMPSALDVTLWCKAAGADHRARREAMAKLVDAKLAKRATGRVTMLSEDVRLALTLVIRGDRKFGTLDWLEPDERDDIRAVIGKQLGLGG